MGNKPLLTIITPVYNGEKYISETIESVINSQIKIPYEYIVLDDGSTDLTASIINTYSSFIKVFTHPNIGEAATINVGIKNAKGVYILIVNADDPLLTGDLINTAYEILKRDSTIVAAYPDWKVIDQYGETLRYKILPDYSDEIFIGHCRCLPGPGTLFRRDAAIKIGGRQSKWKYVSDYDFWLRLSRLGKIVRIPGIFSQWRENPDSTSISSRGNEMAIERILVTEEFLSNNKTPLRIRRMALGNSYYLAARLSFFDGEISGRSLLFKAFKQRRAWPEEAKFYVVLYVFLMPVSSLIFKPLSKLIVKTYSYR
jgi:glycosyltransferase involved in cell wall biosynthesis